MATIIGKGVLEPYSQTLVFPEPVPAACLPALMKVPESYRENIIPVRDGKVLSLDELLYDKDEILVFVSVMGG
jgi:hypothetical protein